MERNLDNARLNPDSSADRSQHVGVGSVLDAVEGIHFPIKKDDLISQMGDKDINLTGHESEKLRVILLRTEADEFLSVTDLVQKIQREC